MDAPASNRHGRVNLPQRTTPLRIYCSQRLRLCHNSETGARLQQVLPSRHCNVAQEAIDAIATELGVAAVTIDQMYQPAM